MGPDENDQAAKSIWVSEWKLDIIYDGRITSGIFYTP